MSEGATNRKLSGKKAVQRGKETEAAFEAQLRVMKASDLLVYDKTYPEVRMVGGGKFKRLQFTGYGGPDWIITLAPSFTGERRGIPLWIETKHVSDSPNKGTLHRVHQYNDLKGNAECGGISGYLSLWRVNGTQTGSRGAIDEWRYHPILPGVDHPSVRLEAVQSGKNAGSAYVALYREHAILVASVSNGLFDQLGNDWFDDIWDKEVQIPNIENLFKALVMEGS